MDRQSNQNAAAIYQQGLAAYETGRSLDAIELLSRIAETSSLPATLARFYLGQAYLRQGLVELEAGRYADAAGYLTAARRINPDSVGLSRYLITCHAGLGRFDMAAAEIERSQATNQNDETLPIRLAHAFARDGQIHRGIETLNGAISSAPRRADLHFQLGVLHTSTEDYAPALSEFSAAARLCPTDAAIAKHLGLVHAALGNHVEASRRLAIAQRLAPHDANTALLLTLALDACGKNNRVAPTFDASQPGAAVPHYRAAEPHDDPAIAELGEVIIHEPDFVEAFLSLPASDVDRELFAMLAATLQRALERHPDYADLHYHCARVYERLGRTNAAIDEARRAVDINPRYVQALIALGRLYGRTDRTSEAIDRLESAIAAGGDYPDVHFMLGEHYRGQGKRLEAVGEYRRALELNSNYSAARQALEAVAIT